METPLLAPGKIPHHTRPKPVILLLDALETLVVAALIYLCVSALLGRVRIESISMEPTLVRGEMVMVDKLSLRFGRLQRGDVIVFQSPHDPAHQYIKRVVGLPGERIRIRDGNLAVDGMRMREDYVRSPAVYIGDWRVPQDAVFVLGDNRNHSSDSHIWGMLPLRNVVGKAFFIYWPPQDLGMIRGLPQFLFGPSPADF